MTGAGSDDAKALRSSHKPQMRGWCYLRLWRKGVASCAVQLVTLFTKSTLFLLAPPPSIFAFEKARNLDVSFTSYICFSFVLGQLYTLMASPQARLQPCSHTSSLQGSLGVPWAAPSTTFSVVQSSAAVTAVLATSVCQGLGDKIVPHGKKKNNPNS